VFAGITVPGESSLFFGFIANQVRRELHGTVERNGDSNARYKGQQAENQRAHGFHVIFEEIVQM
jgi:hypothetical protein